MKQLDVDVSRPARLKNLTFDEENVRACSNEVLYTWKYHFYLVNSNENLHGKNFLECSQYFSSMHHYNVLYYSEVSESRIEESQRYEFFSSLICTKTYTLARYFFFRV